MTMGRGGRMQWHLDAGEGLPARSHFSGEKMSEKCRI